MTTLVDQAAEQRFLLCGLQQTRVPYFWQSWTSVLEQFQQVSWNRMRRRGPLLAGEFLFGCFQFTQ